MCVVSHSDKHVVSLSHDLKEFRSAAREALRHYEAERRGDFKYVLFLTELVSRTGLLTLLFKTSKAGTTWSSTNRRKPPQEGSSVSQRFPVSSLLIKGAMDKVRQNGSVGNTVMKTVKDLQILCCATRVS